MPKPFPLKAILPEKHCSSLLIIMTRFHSSWPPNLALFLTKQWDVCQIKMLGEEMGNKVKQLSQFLHVCFSFKQHSMANKVIGITKFLCNFNINPMNYQRGHALFRQGIQYQLNKI